MPDTHKKVAFQGEHGAYSELAIRRFFPSHIVSLPCFSFADALMAVKKNEADAVMLPVENSLAGSVIPAYDELLNYDLTIIQEVTLRVRHCLLGTADSTIDDIKQAYSHPQALAQCEHHLKKAAIEPSVFADTAGAAAYVARKKDKSCAAIASRLAAEIYDLKILRSHFEDEDFNFTRFFVLSKAVCPSFKAGIHYKTAILFSLHDHPNALVEILKIFGEHEINLSKIESRPSRAKPWDYHFFVDFEGHKDEEHIIRALCEIDERAAFFRCLGSFESRLLS
ncbi:MAG: prephenate dehydratase [Francisellaceae bacterium]